MTSFPWYVHQYPFPLDAKQDPCRAAVTGGRYDPLGANSNSSDATYSDRCANDHDACEVGDLSGRHGPLNATSSVVELTDNLLSLHGIHTIIGRSLVLFSANGTRFVCANIAYPSSSGDGVAILYAPFRNNFTGNIYFRQHTNNSTASVYADLSSIGGLNSTVGHNWHVHQDPLDSAGTDCAITGPYYSPRNINISSEIYTNLCNSTNHMECAVGDLSSKGAPLDVMNRVVKQFYTDTSLTLSGEDTFITSRSIVIHEANGRPFGIACANISKYFPLEAEAIFSTPSDVSGSIRFSQLSPFDPTRVDVNFTGLDNMAGGYYIHIGPIGPPDLGYPDRCAEPYTRGHWNPLDVNDSGEVPLTSDGYKVGDLSGKFGSLANMSAITRTFSDPNLPLFETFGIIGRSVVIRLSSGTPWVCADIVHARPVVTFSYALNTSSVEGTITLIQPADDPYASTTITVTLRVKQPLVLPSSTTTSATSVGMMPSPESTPVPTPTPLPTGTTTSRPTSSSLLEGK